MRNIHDLLQLTQSVMNRDVPLSTRKMILIQYGIRFIGTVDSSLRFQCHNQDTRWYGKVVVAKPVVSRSTPTQAVQLVHAIDAEIRNTLDKKYKGRCTMSIPDVLEFDSEDTQQAYMKDYAELVESCTDGLPRDWTGPDHLDTK